MRSSMMRTTLRGTQRRTAAAASSAPQHCARRGFTGQASKTPASPVPPSPPDTRLGPPGQGQPWWTNRGPITWAGLGIVVGIGGSLTFAFKYFEMRIAEDKFRSVGTAKLGGPFTLVDTDGKEFSDTDLLGNWALLYFGFTTCPDICPAELNKINSVLQTMDQSMFVGPVVQPVLITVDPKRDTREKMAAYVKLFHPRTIGLTGTEDQVRKAARAYRVYYNPTDDDDEHYLVDHSIISYLINPEGKFVAFYGQTADGETMVEKISAHIWEAKKRAFWQSIGLLDKSAAAGEEEAAVGAEGKVAPA